MPVFFALLAALNWGSSSVFVRLGLARIGPAPGTFVTMVVSLALIMALALMVDFRELAHLSLIAVGWLALLGFVNYVMGRFMNFWSVSLAGAARSTPVVAVSPLFSVLFAVALTDERPSAAILIGTFVIVVGLVLIVSESFGNANQAKGR